MAMKLLSSPRPYRLGLDLGTNSIGFALVELRNDVPHDVLHMGVRIFSDGRDPKKGSSLAVDRRLARGMRRRRDRLARRRQQVMEALISYGLMPQDRAVRKALKAQDPYMLGFQPLLTENLR
jgi:CRISPR-associated endonuclease Csn1